MAAVLAIVVVMFLLLAPAVTIRVDNGWTCAYTGSHKRCTVWFGRITTAEQYQASPIEEWLVAHKRSVEHKWVRTMGTRYGMFGGIGSCHSNAPPVYHFLPNLHQRFLAQASTGEIDAFLQLLKNGKYEEAEKAVDVLNRRMIESM